MACGSCNKAQKLRSIAEGWKNYLWPSTEVEVKAYERGRICAGCDHNRRNFCSICHCFLGAKIRSGAEKCPLNYW